MIIYGTGFMKFEFERTRSFFYFTREFEFLLVILTSEGKSLAGISERQVCILLQAKRARTGVGY